MKDDGEEKRKIGLIHHRVIKDIPYHHPHPNRTSSSKTDDDDDHHHHQRTMDVYLPIDDHSASLNDQVQVPSSSKPDRLMIYVHGGAWRTDHLGFFDHHPSSSSLGDKADVYSRGLMKNLSDRFANLKMCSINYRLSELVIDGSGQGSIKIKHPSHNSDVIEAIESIDGLDRIQEIYLVGHSVGAFICLSISGILRPCDPKLDHVRRKQDGILDSEQPSIGSQSIIGRIRGLILIDGIYDLVQLVREYPSYRDFVSGAFDRRKIEEQAEDELEYWNRVSPTSWLPSSSSSLSIPRILIIHSKHDRLLSTHQSELIAKSLRSKLPNLSDDNLQIDLESVTGDHDPLLLSSELIDRIESFLSA